MFIRLQYRNLQVVSTLEGCDDIARNYDSTVQGKRQLFCYSQLVTATCTTGSLWLTIMVHTVFLRSPTLQNISRCKLQCNMCQCAQGPRRKKCGGRGGSCRSTNGAPVHLRTKSKPDTRKHVELDIPSVCVLIRCRGSQGRVNLQARELL